MIVDTSAIYKNNVFILLDNGKTLKVDLNIFPDSIFAVKGKKIKFKMNSNGFCDDFQILN